MCVHNVAQPLLCGLLGWVPITFSFSLSYLKCSSLIIFGNKSLFFSLNYSTIFFSLLTQSNNSSQNPVTLKNMDILSGTEGVLVL